MLRDGTFARRWSDWRRGPVRGIPLSAEDAESATRRFLLYGVLPLWFVPGVADWFMHRRTHIEETSGIRESAVHALMMTEAGVPVVAGLVAKINPLVLTTMAGAAVAHGVTAVWDVSLAEKEHREVRPVEQHIHSFLEVLPLTAAAFTACLHWDQVRSMFHGGNQANAWVLLPKKRPLPRAYLAVIAGAIGVFVVLPYTEEMVRCLRARRRRVIRPAETDGD